VIERLSRRVVGWDLARHHTEGTTYPSNAPRGPVMFVTNEFAGSDGDIVNAAAQAMGVGPVIGMRTWGGVIGIDGMYDLVDGTRITQPRYSFWFRHLGWSVENHGVDPDIVVEHTPADFFAEADPQLDRAIAEAVASLAQTRPRCSRICRPSRPARAEVRDSGQPHQTATGAPAVRTPLPRPTGVSAGPW